MQSEEVFSPSGLAMIFDGEVVPQLRRDGTVEHCRARGFRHESAEAKAAGCVIMSRRAADSQGVYVARVAVRGVERQQSKSGFFPQHWTREEVIEAITEAYADREHVALAERLYKGRGRAVTILLYLDEFGRVVDAMPKRGRVSANREALSLYERTGERSKRLCATCLKPKVLVCPGHDLHVHKSVFSRLKRWLKRR
jgi:hypothetical protein